MPIRFIVGCCARASLRQSAIVEDIDHKAPRGLDRALFQKLIAGEWIH